MTATVLTKVYTGAGPTETTLPSDNLRLCTSDDHTPGTDHPVPIPTTGYNYSYAKSLAFYVSVAPTTSITSIYLYTDGSLGWGAGCAVNVGDQFPTNYVQSTGTENTTGNEMTTFYTGITTTSSLFAKTSGSPLGAITQVKTSGTGRYTKYVVVQGSVTNAASSGAKSAETCTWKYNEV